MRIVVKHPRDITREERLQLSKLHLKYGCMWRTFNLYEMHSRKRVIYCLNDRNRIVGWAYIYKFKKQPYEAHIFVMKSYRRIGVGKKIMNKARQLFKKINVIGWNKESRSFFKTLKFLNIV